MEPLRLRRSAAEGLRLNPGKCCITQKLSSRPGWGAGKGSRSKAAADRYLNFLDHESHIRWRRCVADQLSDHTRATRCAGRHRDYGSPAFRRIDGAIRRLVIEEVAASDLPGLVFTFVWAFDLPEEQAFIDECARPFRERGARVLFVELEATQAERLKRIAGVSRLAEKPSRRDLEASRRDLLDDDGRYQLNSGGKFDGRPDYLRIDNTVLTPGEVAERVIEHFALPRSAGASPT